MLQTVIDGNSSIYHGVSRLHDVYGETEAEEHLEDMDRVSWGLDAPHNSYKALSNIYGYLNTLYCEVYLTNSRKLKAELELINILTARVEAQINTYARYIAAEGRDRI